jgi:hypothetical protein
VLICRSQPFAVEQAILTLLHVPAARGSTHVDVVKDVSTHNTSVCLHSRAAALATQPLHLIAHCVNHEEAANAILHGCAAAAALLCVPHRQSDGGQACIEATDKHSMSNEATGMGQHKVSLLLHVAQAALILPRRLSRQ